MDYSKRLLQIRYNSFELFINTLNPYQLKECQLKRIFSFIRFLDQLVEENKEIFQSNLLSITSMSSALEIYSSEAASRLNWVLAKFLWSEKFCSNCDKQQINELLDKSFIALQSTDSNKKKSRYFLNLQKKRIESKVALAQISTVAESVDLSTKSLQILAEINDMLTQDELKQYLELINSKPLKIAA